MKLPLTQSCRPKRENRSTHLAPLLGEREPQRQSIYGRETLARGDGKCKFARSRQWAKQLAKRLFIFLFHCLKIVPGKSLPPGSVIVTIYNDSNGCRFSKKAYVAVRYRVRNVTFLEKEKKNKRINSKNWQHKKTCITFLELFCEWMRIFRTQGNNSRIWLLFLRGSIIALLRVLAHSFSYSLSRYSPCCPLRCRLHAGRKNYPRRNNCPPGNN